VSSISRMTIRIIFAGSSERSSSSVILAAKMSRDREKIPIPALRIQNSGPCTCPLPYKRRAKPAEMAGYQKIGRFPCEISMKILAKSWDLTPTVGQIFDRRKDGPGRTIHRAEPRVPRRGRAREPRGAAQPPGPGHRRARHGQGAHRRAPPPPVATLGRPADCHELRGAARESDRGGAVRP